MRAGSGKNKIVIGVTGGFSSGKTTVVSFFVKKGALRIDADRIAHTILNTDAETGEKITGLFGKNILSGGKISRKKLGEIVFSDKRKLEKLNSIMHPKIIKEIFKKVKGTKKRVAVVDAPLLIETGLSDHMDLVVLVSASRDSQIKWAAVRGFSEKQAKKIIGSQLPFSLKKTFVDFVIYNNGTVKKIKKGVDRIWQEL